MLRRGLVIFVAAAALGAGCKEPARPSPPDAEPKAAQPTRSSLRTKAIGRWAVKLDSAQAREQKMMILAVRDADPTDKELAELELTPQERQKIDLLRQRKKQSPVDPKMDEMKKVVEGIDKTALEIATSTLSMTVGGVRQEATYSVIEETEAAITIRAKARSGRDETMSIRMPDESTLVLSKLGATEQALTFTRER
jgi:hypothetical protein